MALNESDLLRLLHSTENSFVERKTVGDHKDWVKIVVSFANTMRSDEEGVLFIGATDDGRIQSAASNLDTVQGTFSDKMRDVYPRVYYTTKIVSEDGKECLAVIVPGSTFKPHFAGPAYIRDGSKSVVASSQQYDELIASRIGKTYELQKWLQKPITLSTYVRQAGVAYVVNRSTNQASIAAVNQFFVTIDHGNRMESYPLSRIEISFDDGAGRLQIEITQLSTPF